MSDCEVWMGAKCVAVAAAAGPRLWGGYLLTPGELPLSSEPLHVAAGGGAALRNIAHWRRIVPVNRADRHRYSVHFILCGYWKFRSWVDWFVGKSCILCSGRTRLHVSESVRVSDSVHVRSPPILHHVSSYIGWVSADAAAAIPLGGVQQPGGQPNCIKEDAAQSRAWNEPSRSLKLYRQGEGPYWGLLLRLLPLSHLRHW